MSSLLFFAFTGCISLLLSPCDITLSSLYVAFQLIYWFVLSNIICNSLSLINIKSVALTCVTTLIILFIITFLAPTLLSENETSYIIVLLWPIGLLSFKNLLKIIYVLFIILFSVINGSRTGIVLILMQVAIMLLLIINRRVKLLKKTIIFIIMVVSLLSFSSVRNYISSTFFYNQPIIASIVEKPSVAFSLDKSWVQRQLQIQKCKQIFAAYPIIGIGPLNAQNFVVDINTDKLTNVNDNILSIEYADSFNRSTHNSYYEILAEVGIVGIILILFILVSTLMKLLKLSDDIIVNQCIVTLCGLLINLYMVSSFFGTHTWIMIGLLVGIFHYKNNVSHKRIEE